MGITGSWTPLRIQPGERIRSAIRHLESENGFASRLRLGSAFWKEGNVAKESVFAWLDCRRLRQAGSL